MYTYIKSKLTIPFCFYIKMFFYLFSKNKYLYICTTKHAINIAFLKLISRVFNHFILCKYMIYIPADVLKCWKNDKYLTI